MRTEWPTLIFPSLACSLHLQALRLIDTWSNKIKSRLDVRTGSNFRKILLVSVKFVSAILGPETAAPILWTPGKMRSFCRKTYVHKIPRFRGGYFGFAGGGGSADFIFMGARIFLTIFAVRN